MKTPVFLFEAWEYILDKNRLIKHFKINLHSILLKKIDHLTKSFRDGCWCLFIWLKTLLQVNVSLEIIATISTCIWNKLILGSFNHVCGKIMPTCPATSLHQPVYDKGLTCCITWMRLTDL
jgi:hypothetical protein